MNKVLEIKNLSKSYKESHALDDVSFSVEEGQVVAIMGESGVGKTTLSRIICGFEEAESGTISINGNNVKGVSPRDRFIGLVPQENALFPHLNVKKNIAFGLSGLSKEDQQKEVERCLDLVGLSSSDEILNKKPAQLSGGQQQRVAIARALATNPKIVIMDEAFSSLDQHLRIKVRRNIISTLKKMGTTVIIITHDAAEAFELSDLIVVLEAGRMVQFGTSNDIYFNPVNQTVARLVGLTSYLKLDGKSKLYRPEQISISSVKTQIQGRVVDIIDLGANKQIFVALDDKSISTDEVIVLCDYCDTISLDQEVSLKLKD